MTEDLERRIKWLEEDAKSLRKLLLDQTEIGRKQHALVDETLAISKRIALAHDEYIEKLHAVFRKTFPDHGSFLAEYDRILGSAIGPEEQKKPKG